MTANDFRNLALSLPQAREAAHMNHPDFRVSGKIFAMLGPGEKWGVVKLTVPEQASFIRAQPDGFHPVDGAWGRRGCTVVRLEKADESIVEQALMAAWRSTAPKRLAEQFDEE